MLTLFDPIRETKVRVFDSVLVGRDWLKYGKKVRSEIVVIGVSLWNNRAEISDHVKTTGHSIKWDHFDILAKGKSDYHCKINETLFIQELELAFNVNVGSQKLIFH